MSGMDPTARRIAREALNTAEEALDRGSVMVPFLSFEWETVPQKGFFASDKERVTKKTDWFSVKSSDISFVNSDTDDFGTVHTRVYLEKRCDLNKRFLTVKGTVQEVTDYINSYVQGTRA